MLNAQDTCNRVGRIQDQLDATLYRIADMAQEVDTDPSGRARHNDPNKAAMSRDLLRAQDLTRLMQSELSVLYWHFKGFDDPREEGEADEQAG